MAYGLHEQPRIEVYRVGRLTHPVIYGYLQLLYVSRDGFHGSHAQAPYEPLMLAPCIQQADGISGPTAYS